MSGEQLNDHLVVRALKTIQGEDISVYSFFVPGGEVSNIADISRVERDEADKLKGFQRKEIRNHVNSIVEYLDNGPVLFPNAIILALSPEIEFKEARGTKPTGLTAAATMGTLQIPIRDEGQRVAWIVDGQQRSMALAKTKHPEIPVPVIGFVSSDLEIQREQFILVNKAKPLPTRLINELLPEIGTLLPRDLAVRKIPSEVCNILNSDPNSPFYRLIRRISDDSPEAVIVDTAVLEVIKSSISNPLGALSPFKGTGSEPSDIEAMYRIMCVYWGAVKEVFPDAWAKPPTESRLMHSAGIRAMGVLMDRLSTKVQGTGNEAAAHKIALSRIAPHCCWVEGTWEGLGWKWNEVQATPRHIRGLADHLVRLDFEASRHSS